MSVDVDKFWRDGFVVLPGLIPTEQVERWRSAAEGVDASEDLLASDVLREVVVHPKLLEAAREILGGEPTYFGDSSVLRGSIGWGFHRDNSDRFDGAAPDWQADRYPIIRFGIYTQPHGSQPGGLDLLKGSHNNPDPHHGEMVSAEVNPGDVVVWNGRTTHSGNSRLLRGVGYRMGAHHDTFANKVIRKLGGLPWLFRTHPQERIALFVSYALRSPLFDRHLEYLRSRQYVIDMWARSSWPADAHQLVRQAGLDVEDITAYRHDGRPLNVEYAPIPY